MKVGKVPTGPVESTVKRRARPYSVDRRTERDADTLGSGTSYEREAATAELYLYEPSASETVAPVGEQTSGDIRGLCLPDADIEIGDRVDYGTHRYEVVEPIRHIPNRDQTVVLELSLERVVNPTV